MRVWGSAVGYGSAMQTQSGRAPQLDQALRACDLRLRRGLHATAAALAIREGKTSVSIFAPTASAAAPFNAIISSPRDTVVRLPRTPAPSSRLRATVVPSAIALLLRCRSHVKRMARFVGPSVGLTPPYSFWVALAVLSSNTACARGACLPLAAARRGIQSRPMVLCSLFVSGNVSPSNIFRGLVMLSCHHDCPLFMCPTNSSVQVSATASGVRAARRRVWAVVSREPERTSTQTVF